jgi:serine/threonine protein kinase
MDYSQKLKRELELWRKVHHDNILPLLGIAYLDGDSTMPAFISPWMQDGSVMDFLKKSPSYPVSNFLRDIIKGLCYLHTFDPEIVHGDIKPVNVLVNDRQEACLCDFGLSRFSIDNTLWRTTATQASGTLRWMAPELLEGEESVPTKASDIYAYAMTCYVSLQFRLLRVLCLLSTKTTYRRYCLGRPPSSPFGTTTQ